MTASDHTPAPLQNLLCDRGHPYMTRDFHREVTRLMVMFRMSYVGQGAGFSFLGLACWAELFLNRKLSLPVSRMWQ